MDLNRDNAIKARCASPLVLMNNVTPSPSVQLNSETDRPRFAQQAASGARNSLVVEELEENPFDYWQRTLKSKPTEPPPSLGRGQSQAPHRTVSLGPKRPRQVSSILQANPFLREPEAAAAIEAARTSATSLTARRRNVSENFNQAARELQSSLTELNELIHSPEIGSSATLGRRPPRARQASGSDAFAASRNNGLAIKIENEDGEPSSGPPKWSWQEDLSNWKMSSSVNDLRSMFNQPAAQERPPASASLRPPSSATITPNRRQPALSSALKGNPWLDGSLASDRDQPTSEQRLGRTASVSSSATSRPVLKSPHRGQY